MCGSYDIGMSVVEFVLEAEEGINCHDRRCVFTRAWMLAAPVLYYILLGLVFLLFQSFSFHFILLQDRGAIWEMEREKNSPSNQ